MAKKVHATYGARTAAPFSSRLLAWADAHRWWLFGGVLLLYAVGFTGRWRVAPDTALYMELGRNVAAGRGFTYHGVHHNWYEPGLPYVVATSFRFDPGPVVCFSE